MKFLRKFFHILLAAFLGLLFTAPFAQAQRLDIRLYEYHKAIQRLLNNGETVRLGIIVDKISTFSTKPGIPGWKEGMYQSVYVNAQRRILKFSGFNDYPNFILLDRAGIEGVLKELNFQQTGYLSLKDQTKLGELLGLTHILFISFSRFRAQDPYSFMDQKDIRLVEVKTGRVLAADTIVCYRYEGRNEFTPWKFKEPAKET